MSYFQLEQVPEKFLDLALQINLINTNHEFGKLRKPFKEEWWKNVSFVKGNQIEYLPKENTLGE